MNVMATHPERLIARAADGAQISDADRRRLDAHLETCAACRDELDAQRAVAQVLRRRTESAAYANFSARVAARIERDGAPGFLELANWRAWTVGLAPVAAALVLLAYLGIGSATTGSTSAETTATFESWVSASAGSTPAAVFLQPSASGDQLLETVLTGAVASSGESSNVR
jgi:anti-sigma factor RsiW